MKQPAWRKQIHGPRNRQPGDPIAGTADEAWQWLVSLWSRRPLKFDERASGMVRLPIRYRAGHKSLEKPLAAVLKELEQPARPTEFTAQTEHIRAYLIIREARAANETHERRGTWEYARRLIELWAGAGGLSLCLDILTHDPVIEAQSERVGYAIQTAFALPAEDPFRLDTGSFAEITPLWWALREWVSQRSDDDFARDREVAAALAAHRGDDRHALNIRCRLAYAFSRDPSLAQEVAAPLLRDGFPKEPDDVEGPNPADAVVFLYPSLPDARAVLALIERVFRPEWIAAAIHLSFDIVDAYGAEAAPIFERIIASGKRSASATRHERAALKIAQAGGAVTPKAPAKPKATASKTAGAKSPAKSPKKPAKSR
jgi:hypothetical protein